MREHYDLAVIGSGPGGYVAAARAAQLGLRVACVEKSSRLGGVCLNVGCIPSKALLDSSEHLEFARAHFADHGITCGELSVDVAAMLHRKEQVVETLTGQVRTLLQGHQVEIIHGTARLRARDQVEILANDDSSSRLIEAASILLATGSEPVTVPGLEFNGTSIVSSTEALSFQTVPEHLLIVGGGYIGLELGTVWRRLGAKVTVVEMLPTIAATLDRQVGRSLLRILTRQGMDIRLNTKVVRASVVEGEVAVELESEGNVTTEACDRVLVAVGRRPLTRDLGLEDLGVQLDARTGQIVTNERYQTSVSQIYAIGDLVAGPMLAHKASAEGRAVAESLASLPGDVNYDVIPAIVYTWPEVASVGLTEEQLKERKIPYRTGNFPFTGVGRARCIGEKDGFVKILAHEKTDRVLGVHILGPRASDLIAECTLALEFGASSEDIARTIHGHPTLAEGVQEAALALWNERS